MKRVVIVALCAVAVLILLAVQPAKADRPERMSVLFVGNSYTRFHGMPNTVATMAAESGIRMRVRLAFVAGATLGDHVRRRTALRLLRRGRFTHVVLQGHSLDALERPNSLRRHAARFDSVADTQQMRTVLYQTWARAPDSVLYERDSRASSPEEMQDRISTVYGEIGGALDADVAPVGEAFAEALRRDDARQLHWPDGSHPTRLGSYLAACVLYGTLTGNSPQSASHVPAGVDAEQAEEMRAIAARLITRARR